MTPEEYCLQRTGRAGSNLAYSFLFLPAAVRRDISILYAFCREVDDVVDEPREPQVARIKLRWWRKEIDRAFAGTPQHPVGRALHPLLRRHDLPRDYFHEIIDGMEMDLDQRGYGTFAELALYCHRVAGVVGLLSAEIFGYSDRRTLKYAVDLGIALQLTNIVRDVAEDAARGRIYLPAEEMAQHGVSTEDIRRGRMSEGMRALLRAQTERARGYYERALHRLPEADRAAQRSGVVMAGIYRELLERIEAADFDVFSNRIRLSPWRKLWLAWSTARRESARTRLRAA